MNTKRFPISLGFSLVLVLILMWALGSAFDPARVRAGSPITPTPTVGTVGAQVGRQDVPIGRRIPDALDQRPSGVTRPAFGGTAITLSLIHI